MVANFTGKMLILTFDLLILALAMLISAKLAPAYAKITLISPSTQHWNANYADNYAYLGYYYVLERRRIFCFRALALILMTIPIVYVFSSSVPILLSIAHRCARLHFHRYARRHFCRCTRRQLLMFERTLVWSKLCKYRWLQWKYITFVWANLSMNKHKLNADKRQNWLYGHKYWNRNDFENIGVHI